MYKRHTFIDNETVLTKKILDEMEDGIARQCASVPQAAGENVTKEEFNALLEAMKTAGLMASE